MKKFLLYSLLVLNAVFFWSCQEEEPPFILIEEESVVTSSDPYKTTVVVKSNVNWTVSSNADWCTVYGEKGSYKGSFELVIDRNTTIDDRNTTIVVSGGGKTAVIAVMQTSAGFGFSIPVSEYSVNNQAQELDIAFVLSRPGASVEAFSNVDWIKLGPSGKSSVKVEIAGNKTGKIRNAQIALVAKGGTGDPVTASASIIQSHSEDILDVLVEEITLGSEGETRRIPVQSSSTLDVVSSESWCVAVSDGGFIVVSADANTTGEVREAYVSLKLKDGNDGTKTKLIKVTQAAAEIILDLPVTDISLNRLGAPVKVPFSSDAQISAESGASWCQVAVDGDFIAISGEENETGEERFAYVKVKAAKGGKEISKAIKVSQGTAEIVLDLPIETLTLNAEGQERNIPYTSDGTVSAKANESWISAAVTDGMISVSATPNTTSAAREGILTITATGNGKTVSKTVKILQAKSDVNLELPVEEVVLGKNGEAKSIPFMASDPVTVDSGASWCKTEVRGQYIVISAEKNTSGEIRETYLTVKTDSGTENDVTKSVKVTQAAAAVALELPVSEVVLNKTGAEIRIPYISTDDVEAKAGAEWCEVSVAEKQIVISASENLSREERICYVTVTTQNGTENDVTRIVKVTQTTADVTLEISAMEIALNKNGEEIMVPYTASSKVVAESGAAWCRPVVKGQFISFSAAENNTGKERMCYVTVTTQSGTENDVTRTVKVTQTTADVTLEISVTEITLNRNGEEMQVPYTSSARIKAESGAAWCRPVVKGQFISFSATENKTGKERMCYVTVTTQSGTGNEMTKTVKVVQTTTDIVLDLAESEVSFNVSVGEKRIPYTSSETVKVTCIANWCYAYEYHQHIVIFVDENKSGYERSCHVKVSTQTGTEADISKTIKVTQYTESAVLDIMDSVVLNIEGEEVKVPFSASSGIAVESGASWCIPAVSSNFISFTADRNTTGEDRICYVKVTTTSAAGNNVTKMVKVIQTTTLVRLYVAEKDIVLAPAGEARNIPFICENPVQIKTSENWLSAGSLEEGLINISAGINETGVERTGFVIVTTQSETGVEASEFIKVTQASADISFEFVHAEIPFEYIASAASATLRANGEWEITNLADKPSWISITPVSGSGAATLEIKVTTNKFLSRRNFVFAFRNTKHNQFASLSVMQDGDPTGIKDLGYLGRGYDASGEYAVDSYVRHHVLDQDSLVNYNHVADVLSLNTTKEETITGERREEYEKNYSASAGVKNRFLGFTASVKTNFSQYALEAIEHSYGTWRHMTQKKKLTLFQNEGADELKNSLSRDFRHDIGARMNPEQLIQKYGTHVVTGYALGGVLEYSMSADNVSSESSTNWSVALKGGFQALVFGVNTSAEYEQFNSMKISSASFESTLNCRGGKSQYSSVTITGSQAMYNEWLGSLEDPSQWVMVNYESPMIPIFEFIDESAYRQSVETYLENYLKGLDLPQRPTHKNLTFTEVSASTDMSDAGSDCEFYWNMYVKINDQPLRFNGHEDWGVNDLKVKEKYEFPTYINKEATIKRTPLKNHTLKIEIKNAYEEDISGDDHFHDKTVYVKWDGKEWVCHDGNSKTVLNDDGTFRIELKAIDSNEHLWIQCKLVWSD